MKPTGQTSLTRTAKRLAFAALLTVALLPPALWFGGGLAFEHGTARTAAYALARIQGPADARGGAADAGHFAESTQPQHGIRVGRDGASSPDSTTPHAPAPWPSFEVRATLPAEHGGAVVRIERSLQPLLLQTLWIALLSSLLALVAWAFGMHRSVGEMTRAEDRMRALASVDPMTGLLNRDGLRRRLQRALARQKERRQSVGVLLIDIDRFGLINDTLGQSCGDDLLRMVANRIRSVTRSGDGLARLGGDQFAAHVDTASGPEALRVMARNLQRAFEAPFELEQREVVVSFSFGVAMAGPQSTSVDTLLHHAALAVRDAKKRGGNRVAVHDRTADPAGTSSQRLELEQRLHGALGAGQFFLVYQPIVDTSTERVVMVEALLRWRDPPRGVVAPGEFIPALEQTGLIVRVGQWVLREACMQLARWPQQAEGAALGLSVNLSPLQFAEPDFLDMVTSVLHETGIAPQRLQLEVTEGLLLDPTPDTMRKLDRLLRLGVRLAVDDFGVGYSSLMYLKRFRLHTLKIDRAFVRDIAYKAQDLTIARAIIDLGHGLDMRVTAEGVETREQSDALRQLGCDMLQGYLYGRPEVPAAIPGLPLQARARAGADEIAKTAGAQPMQPAMLPG